VPFKRKASAKRGDAPGKRNAGESSSRSRGPQLQKEIQKMETRKSKKEKLTHQRASCRKKSPVRRETPRGRVGKENSNRRLLTSEEKNRSERKNRIHKTGKGKG